MPDITKTDVLAIIQAVLAVAAAWGMDLSDAQKAAVTGLVSASLAIGIPIADAIRRKGRVPLIMQREAASGTNQV